MKQLVLIVLTFGIFSGLHAESTMKNYLYAKRDTCNLTMDVYTPVHVQPNTPCLVFVFGGGFKMGSKNTVYNLPYLKAMADSGYVVASIDYRFLFNIYLDQACIAPHLSPALHSAFSCFSRGMAGSFYSE